CWVSSLGSSSCFSNETFLSSPRFLPHTISRTIATIRTTTAMPIHNVKFDTMRSILTASGLHCVRWVHPLGNNSRHTVATHRNSVQDIGDIHRWFLVRNDDELGIFAQFFKQRNESA